MISRKSIITFGMVAIPISMYMPHRTMTFVLTNFTRRTTATYGIKRPALIAARSKAEDIVKGYQYDDDKYVVVTDEEIEKIKTEKKNPFRILHFAQLNQISPVYYNKTYQAFPETGGEKAFELLRSALMQEQKIAIGKTVMGTKDTLMAIIPGKMV